MTTNVGPELAKLSPAAPSVAFGTWAPGDSPTFRVSYRETILGILNPVRAQSREPDLDKQRGNRRDGKPAHDTKKNVGHRGYKNFLIRLIHECGQFAGNMRTQCFP